MVDADDKPSREPCPSCGSEGEDSLEYTRENVDRDSGTWKSFVLRGSDIDESVDIDEQIERNYQVTGKRETNEEKVLRESKKEFVKVRCSDCGCTIWYEEINFDFSWYNTKVVDYCTQSNYDNFTCPYCWCPNQVSMSDVDNDFFSCWKCDNHFQKGAPKVEYTLETFDETFPHMIDISTERMSEMMEEAENAVEFSEYVTKAIDKKDKKKKRSEAAIRGVETRRKNIADKRKRQAESSKRVGEARKREENKQAIAVEQARAESRAKAKVEAKKREEKRKKGLDEERKRNQSQTGNLETDQERKGREIEGEEKSNKQKTGILETNEERRDREEIFSDPNTTSFDTNSLSQFMNNATLEKWMNCTELRVEAFDALKVIIQRRDIMDNVRNRFRVTARDYCRKNGLDVLATEFDQLDVPGYSDVPPE